MTTVISSEWSRKMFDFSKFVIKGIQENNGYIFGGAIRDILLHDATAKKFYNAVDKQIKEDKIKQETDIKNKIQKATDIIDYLIAESKNEDDEGFEEKKGDSDIDIDISDINEVVETEVVETETEVVDNVVADTEVADVVINTGVVETEVVEIDVVENEIIDEEVENLKDEEQVELESLYDNYIDITKIYQDINAYPEYVDRFLYPSDIDCFMSEKSQLKFLNDLKKNGLIVKNLKSRKLNIYLRDRVAEANNLMISNMTITFDIPIEFKKIMKIKRIPEINLDIIYQEDITGLYPPFGYVDYECNALILTPTNNYMLSKHLSKNASPKKQIDILNKVIEDISNKQAIILDRVPLYRTEKMIAKGWSIKVKNRYMSYILSKEVKLDEPRQCPLCLTEFLKGDYTLQRVCCKSSVFHQSCFRNMINSPVKKCCPLCNDPFHVEEYANNRKICLY